VDTKLKTIVYSLTLATGGTLFTQPSALAASPDEWECIPKPDFRGWSCLKDGEPPVEKLPAPKQPAVTKKPAQPARTDVTVTPLSEPEASKPQPITDEPVTDVMPEPEIEAAEEKPAPTVVDQDQREVASEVTPAESRPTAKDETEKALSETPDSLADVAEKTDTDAVTPAIDKSIPSMAAAMVRVDNTLPSCIAIDRPAGTPTEEQKKLRQSAPTQVEADEATLEENKFASLSGNVIVTRADQRLKAEQVKLNKETSQADASGNVIYSDSDAEITAESAHIDLQSDVNTFEQAEFTTYDRYSRGKASRITAEKGVLATLEDVSYTSCPPDDTTWLLTADEIELNAVTGRGLAKKAKVEFFDVPIFYAPALSFPIDDRRVSGVLTPRFGHSDDRGTELTVPIYWNIAPDRDATFYPRYMSKRGLQLGAEYRYLNENNDGQINVAHLASDDEYDDEDRWAYKYQHQGNIFNDWELDTRLQRVSDKSYFEDLGNSLNLTSKTHLESRFSLKKRADNWSFHGLLQDYQTVDRTIADVDKPYERLPHFEFSAWTNEFANGFQAHVDSQYTKFDRKNSVTGDRAIVYPSLTYNYDKGGYYIRPKVGVHYTHYSLDDQGNLPSSPTRTVPMFSVDSGMFYERPTQLLGSSMTQTLEPRLYYLFVDEEKQTDIPIFDTGLYDYSSSSLFRENRFSGQDRINDANQVSLAVTSRFLDQNTGEEKLGLTFGQIFYFADRDVVLPGDQPEEDSTSAIIGEIRYRPHDAFVASALHHWNPNNTKTERAFYRLKYQPDDDKILNLAYRYREDELKQSDISFLWPLGSPRWHGIGRWNYSIRDSRTLDTFGGIEYESCCWKTRFVARRWVNDVDRNYDTGVFFELELKGLGSIGNDITSFLETGILGYDRYIDDNDDDKYYY
jgi:LPS-assembly protein